MCYRRSSELSLAKPLALGDGGRVKKGLQRDPWRILRRKHHFESIVASRQREFLVKNGIGRERFTVGEGYCHQLRIDTAQAALAHQGIQYPAEVCLSS